MNLHEPLLLLNSITQYIYIYFLQRLHVSEYVTHGQFSTKSDVYSFGVLVLEIVSGKKNSSFYQRNGSVCNLVTYVRTKQTFSQNLTVCFSLTVIMILNMSFLAGLEALE